MSSTTAATPLDFAALLSRNHRPARVTRLIPKEAYKEPDGKEKHGEERQTREATEKVSVARDVAVSKLVMDLVSKTPAGKVNGESLPTISNVEAMSMPKAPKHEWETLPPSLHEVELGDWEKNIRWEGAEEEPKPASVPSEDAAAALLKHRRNPHLDALVFDESNINWEGSRSDAMEKARNVPLILEMGTAGQSIAHHHLPLSRPMPFSRSKVYEQRYEREWSTPAVSTAELSKGSLHPNRERVEAEIEMRQKKREQAAKDKSSRVIAALGTLALGAGKGRTITSSLMGPGGTERTGRPSRNTAISGHDMEYIEQLELVYNYSLVKPDLSKVELRQFHRPRLPLSVVRKDRPWQFQIRHVASSKKPEQSANASSYQSMVTHAGAVSQNQIRSEADLSPTEGKLVVLEYSEERPPIQLMKGMASKIVNFYRGDRSKCPVSAGGGDRPTRRKRHDKATAGVKNVASSSKPEKPTRLQGPNQKPTTVVDWIGRAPKKSKEDRGEKPAIDVLPEGVTEIMHSKVHGPFIGEVEDGVTQTGLMCNLFVAPMFRHEAESSDFLMIIGKKQSLKSPLGSQAQCLGVVLRPLPTSVFTVGQIEPRVKVFAPNTTGERNFIAPFISYQVAKALTRTEAREGRGLRFDEISDHLFPNTVLQANALRQRIKQVAIYDKNTQIWSSKPIGFEDYPGVEALGRKITPEGVAAYETACATARRLCDLGIHELFSGANSVANIGVAMMYLTGQLTFSREMSRKMRKMYEFMKTGKKKKNSEVVIYQKAADELETHWKVIKRRHEVAKWIYEELQLASWHLTGEFVDVHKNAQGTGMMKLTGIGDPSGLGEGYSFIREVDTKPNKTGGQTNGALSAQIKKITGTENDLRKLTMKQMASLLRSYNMKDKEIATLKRWDRVHVIRDLSTKAASDGMGDGLERFARGEKMKLSDQKRIYQARIQEIWRRQRAALSNDSGGDVRSAAPSAADGISSAVSEVDSTVMPNDTSTPSKPSLKKKEESDSESDDDFAAMLEENMMDVRQTNELMAAHVRGGDENIRVGLSQVTKNDLSKDARELAALKRQREEERATKQEMSSKGGGKELLMSGEREQSMIGKKVVRRRITKIFPDGRQATTFKFILKDGEVDAVLKKKQEGLGGDHSTKAKKEYRPDVGKPVGHAMFEDEDDIDHHRSHSGVRLQLQRTTRTIKNKSGLKAASRKGVLHLGKLKQRVSHEKRIKKRKREEEEADLYVATSKRKGTSNRKERGSARDRMPHVILADKLETIRAAAEKRNGSAPFHRPVPRRAVPRYYEVISDPIDLQTIRDKNQRYEYKTADAFLRDFDLMRSNAIKFNGAESLLAGEANKIYEFVESLIAADRKQLDDMEEAVKEQLGGKKKRKKAKLASKSSASSAVSGNVGVVDGVAVNLGDVNFDGADSDSDESYAGLLQSI